MMPNVGASPRFLLREERLIYASESRSPGSFPAATCKIQLLMDGQTVAATVRPVLLCTRAAIAKAIFFSLVILRKWQTQQTPHMRRGAKRKSTTTAAARSPPFPRQQHTC